MSRIRYLKPEFFEDEHLAELPFWVRLLFAGLWNIADKAGRLEDRPKKIHIKVFPYDKVDIHTGLEILSKPKTDSARPFIIRYKVEGERYIQIVNWYKHQKPHHTEKESVIPPHPPNIMGMVNGNGDGECSQSKCEVKTPLVNGSLTVKKNDKNKYIDSVYLTGEEFTQLKERFGQGKLDSLIEDLDNYIGSTGKRYKSHYKTLLAWGKKKQGEEGKSKTQRDIELEKVRKI